MVQPISFSDLESQLQSELIGAIALDHHQIGVGPRSGCLISRLTEPVGLSRRDTPYFGLPPRAIDPVGLEAFLDKAVQGIVARQSLAIVGADGLVRSLFLRHLAHHPQVTTSHADGLIYLPPSQSIQDVLHQLALHFITTYPELRLSQSQLETLLDSLQLVILVDNPPWTGAQLHALRARMPRTTWVMGLAEKPWMLELETLRLPTLSEEALLQWVGQLRDRPLSRTFYPDLMEAYRRLGQLQWVLLIAELFSQGLDRSTLVQSWKTPRPIAALLERSLAPLGTPERWILAVLLALNGVGVTAEQIARITGPLNPQPSLRQLLTAQLVRVQAGRYTIVPEVAEVLRQDFKSQPWMKRVLAYVIPWAEQYASYPDVLQPELDLLLYSFDWAVEAQLWPKVLQLAQALESSVILSQRWERWGSLLQGALQAARQLRQPRMEAWAWHQLGIRAFAQSEFTAAYDALSQAVKLFGEMAPSRSLALSQHNLERLLQTMPGGRRTRLMGVGTSAIDRRKAYGLLLLICLLTFGLSLWVGLALRPIVQPEGVPETVPDR